MNRRSFIKGLIALANSLKEKIESNNFSISEQITASFGLSIYQKNEDINKFVKRADDALYKVKENGRNNLEFL